MGEMMKMMTVVAVVTAVMTAAMGGAVYKVGDEAGWTNIGYVNYKTWASSKLFRVGDTIVFSYNQIFHNVVRVSYADFVNCNVTTAYETFTSGDDKFQIKYPGHYFFICTSPDHCKAGQKVDIRVPISGGHSAPRPNTADSPAPIQPLPFPYPQPYAPVPSPATSPATPPATTPATPPATTPTTPSQAPPTPSQSPPAPQTPAPVATESPAPTPAASSPEKSTGSQLGFGFKVWMIIMAVCFYLFGC